MEPGLQSRCAVHLSASRDQPVFASFALRPVNPRSLRTIVGGVAKVIEACKHVRRKHDSRTRRPNDVRHSA